MAGGTVGSVESPRSTSRTPLSCPALSKTTAGEAAADSVVTGSVAAGWDSGTSAGGWVGSVTGVVSVVAAGAVSGVVSPGRGSVAGSVSSGCVGVVSSGCVGMLGRVTSGMSGMSGVWGRAEAIQLLAKPLSSGRSTWRKSSSDREVSFDSARIFFGGLRACQIFLCQG